MIRNTNVLIDSLVDDLHPVRPVSTARGLAVAAGSLAAIVLAVIATFGVNWDFAGLAAQPVYMISVGLFLLLGAVCAISVVAQSKPQVGADHSGWKWAALMILILPLAGVVSSLRGSNSAFSASATMDGLGCVMVAVLFGSLAFGAMTWWQRRGAPTSPERAGLLTGIAAGCFGIVGFSLSCTHADIAHIGIWHSVAVATCAVLGRLVLPRLLRW